MTNLIVDDKDREFYFWMDQNFFTRHNSVVGSFTTTPNPSNSDKRYLLPNPNFNDFVSFFQYNLIREYLTEYKLETIRMTHFPQYPSRLESIFLFESEEKAMMYKKIHPEHVYNRELKKVKSNGHYIFSIHDLSWIDFLNLQLSKDEETFENVSRSYWSGEKVKDNSLITKGFGWTREPQMELLYLGRIDF